MRKFNCFVLLAFICINCFSQQNQLWKGFFSYAAIKDISQAVDKVYAAPENTVFSKNTVTNELKTINSIDGLKADIITAVHYSEAFRKIVVGNQNGLLLVVNENDGSVLNVIDILNKPSISPSKKKINHIYEYNGKVYLSCDFGICVFDLATSQFGDTYFIGPAGEEVQVYQTTVLDGFIYAVTQLNGIRRADYSNPNLVDFSQWTTFDSGFWSGIVTFQNQLIASNTNNRVYRHNGSVFQQIADVGQSIVDLRAYNDRLIFTSPNHVYIYDNQLLQLSHITQIPDVASSFTCATAINDKIFVGTLDKGLYQTTSTNPTVFENCTPNGPARNSIFNVKKAPNYLWAVYGDYSKEYNPYPLDEYEISKFSDKQGWEFIPYTDLQGAKSLARIVLNPSNPNQAFVSSFFSGLLKIDSSNQITLFNEANTGSNGLESMVPPPGVDVRVNGPAFDKKGNLWMTNSRIDRAIKVMRSDGQWQSYSLDNITATPKEDSYAGMVIDKNNTKWIPSYRNGVIAFNENYGNKFVLIKNGANEGNLPIADVRCVAVDNRNQLWIGTFAGLRVLPSVDRFLYDNELETNPIIILDNDLAQELFFQQSIMDIVVDGANNKWVSIDGAGAFLVSSDGQETLYHFTKANSPLPSDNILDIEIDGATGEVFFATDKGLVSFKGIATKPAEDLSQVYIYPNPVRPEYNGTVKISGLIDNANVKITDIGGNLVYETTSEGGTIEWDTKAFGKHKVASGVYMIFIASEDGTETKVKKVMIVR
ncbi:MULTISPECIES: T9SS type A sorting domain-containing protein [Flavobacterium]|uniref:type IX secretion system anionic LPS delivery protein PorZ n=1 Tax=Flavobacterium TaxID=237 RepID=UPI001FCBF6FD|nr:MULTISPECIES: T9SS type A sorting domain-containing protein [Flavobacterium]UOK43044.1 T9SS type A sorting domain-containing protein [Flavobacterium enshiense]